MLVSWTLGQGAGAFILRQGRGKVEADGWAAGSGRMFGGKDGVSVWRGKAGADVWGARFGGEIGADVWRGGSGVWGSAQGQVGAGGGGSTRGLGGWILDFALLALILRGREYGDTDCYG